MEICKTYSQVSNKRACSFINFQHFAPYARFILPCSFIIFCSFCLFIRVSIKRHMELLHCEQDLLFYRVHIISNSANSKPKLSLIFLLFNIFSPARLLDFQKNPPCSFIPSCSIIKFQKISTLLFYSILESKYLSPSTCLVRRKYN